MLLPPSPFFACLYAPVRSPVKYLSAGVRSVVRVCLGRSLDKYIFTEQTHQNESDTKIEAVEKIR